MDGGRWLMDSGRGSVANAQSPMKMTHPIAGVTRQAMSFPLKPQTSPLFPFPFFPIPGIPEAPAGTGSNRQKTSPERTANSQSPSRPFGSSLTSNPAESPRLRVAGQDCFSRRAPLRSPARKSIGRPNPPTKHCSSHRSPRCRRRLFKSVCNRSL